MNTLYDKKEIELIKEITNDVVTIMNGRTFNSNYDYTEELRGVVYAYMQKAYLKGKESEKQNVTKTLEDYRTTLLKEIEKKKTKKREYDGDDLESASDYYGIAAESWTEITRFQNGFSAGLNEASEIIERNKI